MDNKEIALKANRIRVNIIKMLEEAKAGHTAGPLGMADVFATIYFKYLKHDPGNPTSEGRDFVFLSNGHICPVLYATMAETGYFPEEELMTFRKINSRLQGHPHNTSLPGIENSGGPLAQGLSQAVGCALALQRDGKPNKVYCLCSDGEHDEGQAWEAAMFAGNNQLKNLVAIMDRNNIQIDGFTDEIMDLEPLADKYRAFKWNVIEIDGHDISAISTAIENAQGTGPTMIIAKTTPGKGVKEFENKPEWHGKPPNQEEAASALAQLKEARKQLEGSQ